MGLFTLGIFARPAGAVSHFSCQVEWWTTEAREDCPNEIFDSNRLGGHRLCDWGPGSARALACTISTPRRNASCST